MPGDFTTTPETTSSEGTAADSSLPNADGGGGDSFDYEAAATSIGTDLGFEDPADPSPEEAALGGSAEEPEDATAADTTSESTAPDPALTPPKTWRKEAAAHWASLTPEVRSEILRREEDMFRGLESYKADAGFGKNVKSAMAQYLPTLEKYGIDPVQQVGSLMHAHFTLATGSPEQKADLFRRIAKDYGVDLAQFAGGDTAPYVDPQVQALQDELNGIKSHLTAEQRARQEQVRQARVAEIDAFAADPKNAFFEDVASDMATLIEKGVASTLQDAYEKALWTNPAVRAKVLAKQAEDAAKATREAAAKRAADARKATAATVRTSAKGGSAAAPLGSIDDTLAETLASINSRG